MIYMSNENVTYLLKLNKTTIDIPIFVPILDNYELTENIHINTISDSDFSASEDYSYFGEEVEDALQSAYGNDFKEKSYTLTWLPKENEKDELQIISVMPSNSKKENISEMLIETYRKIEEYCRKFSDEIVEEPECEF